MLFVRPPVRGRWQRLSCVSWRGIVAGTAWGASILSGHAGVLLDDGWADGTRTDTALPAESAWYASSGTSLASAVGSMTGTTSTSSRTWWTYFTTNAAGPVLLDAGDTLKVTLVFSPTGVNANNTSFGLRLGLFDFSNGTRTTADGNSPNATGVAGYLLNLNFGQTYGVSAPVQIRKRTTLSSDLMGSSGDYTTLGAGGGASGDPGFVSGAPYTLEFSVKHGASSLEISATFLGTNGWSISTTATDTNSFNGSFDTFAIRPANTAQTATSFTFTEFKVELFSGAPTAPSIATQPKSLTVNPGATAAFTVVAGGSSPLAYQWYFNTNTPLAGATNATLTIATVQATNAGSYSVVVSNNVGSITSDAAVLVVSTNPIAPSISIQPQSQTVPSGQSASFAVVAGGTQPLAYQWYPSPNAPWVGATNATVALFDIQPTQAGGYFVVVTNAGGSITSSVAILTVTASLADAPGFDLIGFAALDGFVTHGTSHAGGTTGGAGGAHVQVSTLADFVKYLQTNTTLMVEVMNDMDLSALANHSGGFPANYLTGEILVRSHKTVYSKNGATLRRGSLRIGKPSLGPQQNIIIRNLRFRDLWVFDPSGNYDTYGWDYVHIEEASHHIWVDHCDFEQVYDGMIDVTHAGDLVTVSWNVFHTQKKCSLIGHSDNNDAEDTGHLNVTFHHNWYVDVDERMPRMRFGNAHVFNLYCENLGGKGVQSTCAAATLVENSWFDHPNAGAFPTIEANGGPTGTVKVVNSVIVNWPTNSVQFREFGQSGFAFNAPYAGSTPPYPYTPDAVTNVANLVTNYAGLGKVGFELWQMEQFTLQQLTNASIGGRYADPDGDGFNNYQEYLAGTNPTNRASALRMISAVRQGDDIVISWATGAGRTCQLQAIPGINLALAASNFVDLGGPIVIPGSGDIVTNSVDAGGATNSGTRFYRVRVTP